MYAVTAGWVLGNMLPFFYLLKVLGHFRVPANDETIGLDESYHGGGAYPGHGVDSDFDKSHQGNDSFKGFDKVRPCCSQAFQLFNTMKIFVALLILEIWQQF